MSSCEKKMIYKIMPKEVVINDVKYEKMLQAYTQERIYLRVF